MHMNESHSQDLMWSVGCFVFLSSVSLTSNCDGGFWLVTRFRCVYLTLSVALDVNTLLENANKVIQINIWN